MGKRVVRRKIYPELYVHIELKREFTRAEKSRIQEQLTEASQNVFWEVFGRPAWDSMSDRYFSVEEKLQSSEKISKHSLRDQTKSDYEFSVVLEDGSLKVKIAAGAATLYFAIGSWGSFVSGANDIASRLRWAQDNLLPRVYQVIGVNNIAEEIRHERRIGAVGRLDELIDGYQNHRINQEDFLEEGNAILQKIAQSEDRELLIPLVSHYLDQQYGIEVQNFYLPNNLPQNPHHWPEDVPGHHIPALGPVLMLPHRENEDD